MKLTQEQLNIINSNGNIKINAVAGSGKTTTIIEYAKALPKNSKILYLAFNKSVKMEAIKKFAGEGLTNVKVETAHSLAYKNIVFRHRYKVKPQGYKTHEIASLLGLRGADEKHAEYIAANHINKFISYFCNSDKQKVRELNYREVVSNAKALEFVTKFYGYLEKQTRLLLSKMNNGEIEVIHDFYLKKFQLSNPKLFYDYILFDEGQDASQAMLDIFLKQKAVKVIVGDTHQQIYSWRFAVNSLEKADFKTFHLSTSFRFSQKIADLAKNVLKLKSLLGEYTPVAISGAGNTEGHKSKAALARTNLGLLLKAIEFIKKKKKVKRIYFEGNINSYTYADEGTSLYDVLNLYNGNRNLIRDALLKEMKGIDELEDYIDKTEDVQLGMMVEIVREYGNEIPSLIKALKEKHVKDEEKEKAEMIFSTVHRCKGMEYDEVFLVDDFINEDKIEKIKADYIKEEINTARLNEEINLLYVAVTRTRNIVYIPDTLLPKGNNPSSKVHVTIAPDKRESRSSKKINGSSIPKYKSSFFDKTRERHPDAYSSWTVESDSELKAMLNKGIKVKELAKHFGRTRGAIKARIKKLEL